MKIPDNLVLVWMPWCWKSTIWKHLAVETWKWFLDVDDHIEEVTWDTVWNILKTLWDDAFLDFEAWIVKELDLKNTIISTSWSVPLRQDAMNHLRRNWTSILIDIPLPEIYARLQRMKVDRIVWMWKMTLEEILEYRRTFYELSTDIKFATDFSRAKVEVINDFFNFYRSNFLH